MKSLEKDPQGASRENEGNSNISQRKEGFPGPRSRTEPYRKKSMLSGLQLPIAVRSYTSTYACVFHTSAHLSYLRSP